jgi:hypothetical protein
MEELKPVYDIFGKPENLELVEDDHGHGYTQKNRQAMYAFFQKHLNLPGSSDEEAVEYLTEQELQKTTSGQLATSLEGETVFSLNRRESEKFIEELENSRKDLKKHLTEVPISAKRLSGYREPSSTDKPVFTGRIQKKGHVIEKYFINGEGNYVIPYLLFLPEKPNSKAIIYIHPGGKAGIMEEEDKLDQLLSQGFTVLAPDLIGTGELGNGILKGDAFINNISYNVWFSAMLVGRSILGVQASDLVKLSHLLKQKEGINHVYGIARQEMSPVLLHAAAFDPVISRVALIEPYSSYRSFAMNPYYNTDFVYSLVPGALTSYDLPDLAASMAPTKLLITRMTDANARKPEMEEFTKDTEVIKKAYQSINSEGNLKFIPQDLLELTDILEWAE